MADIEKEKKPKYNQEIDTTLFVNIDSEPFDIFIGGVLARHLEAGEEDKIVMYVAQVGAKHLVDRILQRPKKEGGEYELKDSNMDSPLRKQLFAKILPNLAEQLEIKPANKEEFEKMILEQVEKQNKVIAQLQGELAKKDEKSQAPEPSDEVLALRKEVADLKALFEKTASAVTKKSPGRPKSAPASTNDAPPPAETKVE